MGAMIYFRVLCLSEPEICHHLWGVAISRSFSWHFTCEGHTVCELCHGCYLYTGHKKLVWKSPDLLDDLECHHTQNYIPYKIISLKTFAICKRIYVVI